MSSPSSSSVPPSVDMSTQCWKRVTGFWRRFETEKEGASSDDSSDKEIPREPKRPCLGGIEPPSKTRTKDTQEDKRNEPDGLKWHYYGRAHLKKRGYVRRQNPTTPEFTFIRDQTHFFIGNSTPKKKLPRIPPMSKVSLPRPIVASTAPTHAPHVPAPLLPPAPLASSLPTPLLPLTPFDTSHSASHDASSPVPTIHQFITATYTSDGTITYVPYSCIAPLIPITKNVSTINMTTTTNNTSLPPYHSPYLCNPSSQNTQSVVYASEVQL
eukprot:TRINITY_DN5629_c0_g1_i1.p1 TRINITY_DN5629_c0_g1~~TRINITY_DN5629_c0_g1_i1.p1  ORF type:complete len:280 (-),score=37.81 TRINITY_DN5629_c0_g1_i1:54-860(-)